MHVNVSWNVYGVSDTVEKRTCLPSALGQTLQCLSAHRIILDSILVMGMGGTWHVGAWRDPGRDAFTREAARVGFLRKLSWGGAGKIDEREGSSNISVQCLFNNAWREV